MGPETLTATNGTSLTLEGTGSGRARYSARRRSLSASATTRWCRSQRRATSRPSLPTSWRPTALIAVESGRSVPRAAKPGRPDMEESRANETMIRAMVVFIGRAV